MHERLVCAVDVDLRDGQLVRRHGALGDRKQAVIVRISDADFKNRVSPVYPDMAKEMNIQGDVTVKCIVGPDGNVEDARVVESSGSTELDDAGLTAAQETTYAPAHLPQTYGGLPIGWAYLLIYTFALR